MKMRCSYCDFSIEISDKLFLSETAEKLEKQMDQHIISQHGYQAFRELEWEKSQFR